MWGLYYTWAGSNCPAIIENQQCWVHYIIAYCNLHPGDIKEPTINAIIYLLSFSFVLSILMFANKGPYSQNYGFFSSHVWMWELDYEESWALKNWCFWIVLEKTLGIPWTARRSNQSILKNINPEYSLERLMLKLKLQYFGYTELNHWKRPWCWERSKAGGEGDDREWDGWMVSSTQWTWVWANSR